MSDTISRKALIKMAYCEWLEKNPHTDEYTISTDDLEILLSSTESEGEADTFWRTMYEQERDLAKGQKDHLRTENESLKAITELAAKGFEYIGTGNESFISCIIKAKESLKEIERLSK